MGKKLTFLHTADLHLGAPMRGFVDLTDSWSARLQRAIVQAYDRVIEAAIANEVDFVVIAGDVFDTSGASFGDFLHFFEGLQQLDDAGIPVYMTTGNHDPFSLWKNDIVRLPPTCHMMGGESAEFCLFERDGEPLCLIGARGYRNQAWPIDEPIAGGIDRAHAIEVLEPSFPQAKDAPFCIGVIHTALDPDQSKAYSSLDELLAADVDYWACGHLHKRCALPSEEYPRVVFPGCIQGRDLKEEGEHGCYLVTMEEDCLGQLGEAYLQATANPMAAANPAAAARPASAAITRTVASLASTASPMAAANPAAAARPASAAITRTAANPRATASPMAATRPASAASPMAATRPASAASPMAATRPASAASPMAATRPASAASPAASVRASIEFVPTASVVFHTIKLDVSACQTLPDVAHLVQAQLFHENGKASCDEMVERVLLCGRTDLHDYLRRPEVIRDLRKRIIDAYPSFYCDALVDCTRPLRDRGALLRDGLFEAQVVRVSDEQRAAGVQMINYVQDEFVKYGINVPSSLARDIRDYAEEAETIVLDLLGEEGR